MTKHSQCLLLAAVLERPERLGVNRLGRAFILSAHCFSDPGARWLAREIILTGADLAAIRAAAPDPRWLAKFEQWAKTVHPTDQQLEKLPIEHDCDRTSPEVAALLAAEEKEHQQRQAAFSRRQYRKIREAEERWLREVHAPA